MGAVDAGMIQFWAIAGGMALAVGLAMARALLRPAPPRDTDPDLRVYRDQLAEIDRDRARGVLSDSEAVTARAEVARRLLDLDRRGAGTEAPVAGPRALAAAAVVVAVIGATAAVYWQIGAPGYADVPLAERLATADALRATRPGQAEAERQVAAARPAAPAPDPQMAALMDRLRSAIASRPDDLEGHRLLARNEAALGNFAAAAAAQARVVAILGDAATAADHADLAEMRIVAAGGYVSPEAEAALDAALALDPDNGPARYYSGLLYAQTGRADLAFAIWDGLRQDSAPDAPWLAALQAQLPEVAAMAGIRYDPPAPPAATQGPTEADIAAAADMDPEARAEMIRGMVEGLAGRLAADGGSPADWGRLIAALTVLGENDRARTILTEARTAFADAPGAIEEIEGAARRAGLIE
jgi:cytochrome c-type biogenesis protein CcmH